MSRQRAARSVDRITGLAAVGLVLVLATSFAAVRRFPELFGPRSYHVTVLFPDVTGVEQGESVRCQGVAIGRVVEIELEEDHVAVVIALPATFSLKRDARFKVEQRSVLGGGFIAVEPGTGRPTVQRIFAGEGPVDAFAAIGELFGRFGDTAVKTGPVGDLVGNLEAITDALELKRGFAGELLDEESAARAEIGALMDGLAPSEGSIAADLGGDGEIGAAMRDIRDAVAAVPWGERAVGVMVEAFSEDETEASRMVAEIRQAVGHVSDAFDAGRGSARLLKEDDLLWQRFGDLSDALKELGAGEGGLLGDLFAQKGEARGYAGELVESFERFAARFDDKEKGPVERPDLFKALSGVFSFFGVGGERPGEPSYIVDFYSLFKQIGLVPSIREH